MQLTQYRAMMPLIETNITQNFTAQIITQNFTAQIITQKFVLHINTSLIEVTDILKVFSNRVLQHQCNV